SSKKFINPKHWDQKMMKMKGNTEEARSINSYLEKLKAKITQTQIVLEYQEIALTLESFMNVFIGKSAERERTLIPVFEEHNKRLFSLVGIEYAQGTYDRYQTSLQHTKQRIQYQDGVNDIALSKIDHRFITDYDFYLRTKRACGNNTTVRYIKNFKKIILICIANGWIQKDPFLNYKTKIQEVERDILSQEELQ